MGIEVLKAIRNLRTAIQGEKGDIVPIVGYAPSTENHEELLLPRNRGEDAKHQWEMREMQGHFAAVKPDPDEELLHSTHPLYLYLIQSF